MRRTIHYLSGETPFHKIRGEDQTRFPRLLLFLSGFMIALFNPTHSHAQAGFVREGVGPINQSMGGATVANPLEASGTLYWNPAGISFLKSQTCVGVDILRPEIRLSSRVDAGAIGVGKPSTNQSGSTDSRTATIPFPSFGMVHRMVDSRWTFGIGAYVMGSGVNYPADAGNPILSPQSPNGIGLGRLFTNFILAQIAPTVSYQFTDHLSVGISPTINWVYFHLNPYGLGSPDDADQDGTKRYPVGASADNNWGFGLQAGVYYSPGDWQFGASLKSPQKFGEFQISASDERGGDRQFRYKLDYPLIGSIGVGYSGLDRTRFAVDVRYIDFENTEGVGGTAEYRPDGSVTAPGWRSIFLVAAGVQRELTDKISVRLGYTYNQNPVRSRDSFFDTVAPGIVQHHASTGLTYKVANDVDFSVAYTHAFQNTIEGPYVTPSGPVPATSVQNALSIDILSVGVTIRH